MTTDTPSNSTPPFRIGDRVRVLHGERVGHVGRITAYSGGMITIDDGLVALSWNIEHAPPDRLTRARAALEVEAKQHWHALQLLIAAIAEKEAAEKEAEAARGEIPAALLSAARDLYGNEPYCTMTRDEIGKLLARSHGIDPAHLRARLESEKT